MCVTSLPLCLVAQELLTALLYAYIWTIQLHTHMHQHLGWLCVMLTLPGSWLAGVQMPTIGWVLRQPVPAYHPLYWFQKVLHTCCYHQLRLLLSECANAWHIWTVACQLCVMWSGQRVGYACWSNAVACWYACCSGLLFHNHLLPCPCNLQLVTCSCLVASIVFFTINWLCQVGIMWPYHIT